MTPDTEDLVLERLRAHRETIKARNKAYRNANLEKVRAWARARYYANREKILAQSKAVLAANPGRVRANNLKYAYGITTEQYHTMLDKQGGACAICGTTSPGVKGNFHVDHDHATKTIRGLLCRNCNTALGLLKDSIDIAQAAVAYLVQQRLMIAMTGIFAAIVKL